MSALALKTFHRVGRALMIAGMFVMFLPFGVLVGIGKAVKLLSPVKDVI